MNESILN